MRQLRKIGLGVVLCALSGAALAGLESGRPELLRLHNKTVRSAEVTIAVEGYSAAAVTPFTQSMTKWVQEALRSNGYAVDGNAKGAPDVRFAANCNKAIAGCSIKLSVARDVFFDLPEGVMVKLPAHVLVEDEIKQKVAKFSRAELFPLFSEMMVKLVTHMDKANPSESK